MPRFGHLPLDLSPEQEFFATNHVARIVGMTCSPDDFEPERLADQYSTIKTATATPLDNFTLQWNTENQPTTALELPRTDTGVFLFRDAIRNTVMYAVPPDANGRWYAYQAIYSEEINSQSGGPVTTIGTNDEECITDSAFWGVMAQPPTGFTPPGTALQWASHGNFCYSGFAKEKRGVWIDAPQGTVNAGFQVDIPQTALTAAATDRLCLTLYYWNGGVWEYCSQTHVSGTAIAAAAVSARMSVAAPGPPAIAFGSGYYAVDANFQTGVGETIERLELSVALYTESNSSFSHHAIRDVNPYTIAGLKMSAIRILGASMLIKNVASPMFQQGSLVAVQAPGNTDWFQTYVRGDGSGALGPGSGFYNYVFSQAEEKDFRLANGYFNWLKPGGDQDYAWSNNIKMGNIGPVYSGNIPESIQFDLVTPSDYTVFSASTTSNLGGECLLKTSISMEYRTSNMLIQVSQPVSSIDDWKAARAILKTMQNHFENPSHLASILGTILGTIGKVATVAAPILALVPGIGGILGAGATGLGMIGTGGAQVVGMIDSAVEKRTEARKLAQRAAQAVEEDIQEQPALKRYKRPGIVVNRRRRY